MTDPTINAIARVLCCGNNCTCETNSLNCCAEDMYGDEAAALKTCLPRMGFEVVETGKRK